MSNDRRVGDKASNLDINNILRGLKNAVKSNKSKRPKLVRKTKKIHLNIILKGESSVQHSVSQPNQEHGPKIAPSS